MSSIGKAIGRLFGVPKAPKVKTVLESDKPEDKTPTPLPVQDDPNIRAAVLEEEKKARKLRGRSYTANPGRSLGGSPTVLG